MPMSIVSPIGEGAIKSNNIRIAQATILYPLEHNLFIINVVTATSIIGIIIEVGVVI